MWGALVALWVGSGLDAAHAQSPRRLSEGCPAGAEAACTTAWAAGGAVAAQVAAGGSLGADLPGSPAALGWHLGLRPRVAAFTRGGLMRARISRLDDPEAAGSGYTASILQAGGAVGIFDGVSLTPTTPGFLAVDLVARVTLLGLPRDAGFLDGVAVVTYGLRLGIVRETFSLPGVALSLTRSRAGRVALGQAARGDAYDVETEPVVTSLRATVGKDLLALGLMAGVGWDRVGGRTAVGWQGGRGSTEALRVDRWTGFVATSWTALVLQGTVEAGWAGGPRPVGLAGGYDPGEGTLFVSAALRLTL